MAMNYVGNISILDRGDAPAQAVIDRNARSLAQRVADETKDELHKVMDRVDNVCTLNSHRKPFYEESYKKPIRKMFHSLIRHIRRGLYHVF